MNPPTSNSLNRLLLVVLVLNLVCLVLLVIRSYQKPLPAETPAVASQSPQAEPALEAAPPPVLAPVSPRRTAAAPAVRPLRAPAPPPAVSVASTPTPDERPLPAHQPSPPPPPLVNLGNTRGVTNKAPQSTLAGGNLPGLSGYVTLLGNPPREIPIDFGPTCGPLHPRMTTTRHFVVNREGGLADVLVWLASDGSAPALADPPVLDQKGCLFEPYVLGMVTGQKLRVRNSDPVLHNVHFTPKNNRGQNFAQTRQGQINEISFANPEFFVRVKCDVHPWMFAYVSVLPHPYFAVTDTNGFYQIPSGFPPGHYSVLASHQRAGEFIQEIDLPAGNPMALNFQFLAPETKQARR